MRFKGKVAFVTGGGSGIGRAAALAFAKQGAAVAVLDIDQSGLQATAQLIEPLSGEFFLLTASIAREDEVRDSVEAVIDRWGRIDFLFNNAGMEHVAPLLDTSVDDWDAVLSTNLKGTFLVTKLVVAHMVRTGGGVIVNNASDAGLRGIRLSAAYSTSKAGIVHFTRSVALDYAAQGIRCNCICPGCIATPLCERFNAEVGAREGKSGKDVLNQFVMANIPMQRVGTADEVASVVTFLCSHEAAYINGAVLPVDGGLTAGM